MGSCKGFSSMNPKNVPTHVMDNSPHSHIKMKQEPPGYCVECHKPLDADEIICGPCQDECDGRWDHLREDSEEKE